MLPILEDFWNLIRTIPFFVQIGSGVKFLLSKSLNRRSLSTISFRIKNSEGRPININILFLKIEEINIENDRTLIVLPIKPGFNAETFKDDKNNAGSFVRNKIFGAFEDKNAKVAEFCKAVQEEKKKKEDAKKEEMTNEDEKSKYEYGKTAGDFILLSSQDPRFPGSSVNCEMMLLFAASPFGNVCKSTPKGILEAMKPVCEHIKTNPIPHLFIPLIGTGGAANGLDEKSSFLCLLLAIRQKFAKKKMLNDINIIVYKPKTEQLTALRKPFHIIASEYLKE